MEAWVVYKDYSYDGGLELVGVFTNYYDAMAVYDDLSIWGNKVHESEKILLEIELNTIINEIYK